MMKVSVMSSIRIDATEVGLIRVARSFAGGRKERGKNAVEGEIYVTVRLETGVEARAVFDVSVSS
jgi:hypothetical protein